MDKKIMVLDCTLRDGAYIVGSRFGDAAIIGIIQKLRDAGIDIIERRWLKDSPHQPGSSFFHVPADDLVVDAIKQSALLSLPA